MVVSKIVDGAVVSRKVVVWMTSVILVLASSSISQGILLMQRQLSGKLVISMIQFLTLNVWCYSDNDWDTLSYESVMWFES